MEIAGAQKNAIDHLGKIWKNIIKPSFKNHLFWGRSTSPMANRPCRPWDPVRGATGGLTGGRLSSGPCSRAEGVCQNLAEWGDNLHHLP